MTSMDHFLLLQVVAFVICFTPTSATCSVCYALNCTCLHSVISTMKSALLNNYQSHKSTRERERGRREQQERKRCQKTKALVTKSVAQAINAGRTRSHQPLFFNKACLPHDTGPISYLQRHDSTKAAMDKGSPACCCIDP